MSLAVHEMPVKAIEALQRGSMVEAVKIARDTYGIGLKQAKEIVDEYLERNPILKQQIKSSKSNQAKRSWLSLLIMAGAIALMVYLALRNL